MLDWRHNAQSTSAMQGGTNALTICRRVKLGWIAGHTRRTAIDDRTGLTSWKLTRWRDQHTSDKVAHYSIYRPRKDERLSWPIGLNYDKILVTNCRWSDGTVWLPLPACNHPHPKLVPTKLSRSRGFCTNRLDPLNDFLNRCLWTAGKMPRSAMHLCVLSSTAAVTVAYLTPVYWPRNTQIYNIFIHRIR